MSTSELPPAPRLPPRPSSGRRRSPRERSLTKESIAEAALRIVDADGLDALTMRHVGELLGTGAASLYAHVSGKEELLELVIERVIAEVKLPSDPDPARWREQLKEYARSVRETFARHRDLARASFARIPTGENMARTAERMLSLLRAGGLADRVVALAPDLLSLYVMAIAYEDGLQAAERHTPEEVQAFVAELREYFASLPADRFPNIVALAELLTEGDQHERFEFGLEVLIEGLVAVSRRLG